MDKLERVQENAARLVLKRKKRDEAKPLFKKLHWLPVKYRVIFKINLLTFKCLHGMAPEYLSELIDVHRPAINTRSSEKGLLVERKTRTVKAERAFSIAAPNLWNDLPHGIRVIEELSTFKTSLKTYYFKKAFG